LLFEEVEALLLLLLPLLPSDPSKTMKFAVEPFETVTTQNVAPPAPTLLLPTISLTSF